MNTNGDMWRESWSDAQLRSDLTTTSGHGTDKDEDDLMIFNQHVHIILHSQF